ncbi:MlaD family protein [bacterium]|nr:MlaD family protein [bacterium]
MSKQANPTTIGAFVVGAITLVIIGILVFSNIRFLTEKQRFVTYFQGSVNGLQVGAPVKLKGVQVGQVTNIEVELNLDEAVVRTPVYLEVDVSHVKLVATDSDPNGSDLSYESLIRHGLRTKLMSQSLLTGQRYIEINFYPQTPIELVGGNPKLKEIPSLPSETDEIINDVGIIISKLKKLPLNELVDTLLLIAKNVEQLVSSSEIQNNARKLEQILDALQALVTKLTRDMDPLITEFSSTMSDTRRLINNVDGQIHPLVKTTQETLAQARKSLASMEDVASENSPAFVNLATTLEELSDAAQSINNLANFLQRNPESILFGKRNADAD